MEPERPGHQRTRGLRAGRKLRHDALGAAIAVRDKAPAREAGIGEPGVKIALDRSIGDIGSKNVCGEKSNRPGHF